MLCGYLFARVNLGQTTSDLLACKHCCFRVFLGTAGDVEAKCAKLFPLAVDGLYQILVTFFADVGHDSKYYTVSVRRTMRVLSGSFAPALRSALTAVASSTPSTSKSMRPGRTSNTYPWSSPFPLPIPTCAPFCV